MIFAEEMNSYFGGPTFQPNSASAGIPTAAGGGGGSLGQGRRYEYRNVGMSTGGMGPPPPAMEPWKGGGGPLGPAGGGGMSSTDYGGGGYGAMAEGGGSKLITKWGGHHPPTMDYAKQQHQQNAADSGSGGMSPFTPTGAPPYGAGAPWNEPPHPQHHAPHQMLGGGGHATPFQPLQFQPTGMPQDAMVQAAETKFSQLNLKAPAFQPAGMVQQATSGLFTPPVEMGIQDNT